MSKTETEVDVEGVVEEAFANAKFRVRLANGQTAMPPINIDETLAAHANDFEVTSEEDLRTNV